MTNTRGGEVCVRLVQANAWVPLHATLTLDATCMYATKPYLTNPAFCAISHHPNTTRTMVLAELGGKLRDSLRKHLHASAGSIDEEVLNDLLSEMCRALVEADVNVSLVSGLRTSVQARVAPLLENDSNKNLPKLVQRAVIDELTALLQPSGSNTKPYKMRRGKTNIILFVGLQGAGKTTTIAKYAKYYSKRGWKVSMVCADTFRAGALDQLKQNATKLRIPFYGSYSIGDPVEIAKQGVDNFLKSKYEIVLVDTSGRHKQEASLLEEMQELSAAVHPHQTVLVLDATQGQAVRDQAAAFSAATPVGAVILTKLDGHAKGGGALSAVAATNAPVVFTGSGEHFDDLQVFSADSFVSQLLGFGDLRGLMEAMKGDGDEKKQAELMEKMQKGEFTLRDMYQQFEKILNMGPLNKIAGMIPGMPDYLIPKGGGGSGESDPQTAQLRKFMVMMDSMNNKELDGKIDMRNDPTADSRIRRIAAGSGCHPNEVKMLLLAHRQMEGMVSKMGKSCMMGGGGKAGAQQQQMLAQMRKNPHLLNQRLNQMDPRVLQQMGGREQVMQLMQQQMKGGGGGMPGGAGGMPSMEAMQAMMGGMGMGGGGMPGMGGIPGMPNMGGGGGGMPNMGGMDMEAMMKMAQSMGMGGMMPPGGAGRR